MNEYKVLVEVLVPSLDKSFDVYLPINRRIGNIINLLNKALVEESNGEYVGSNNTMLYDSISGQSYAINSLLRETNIRNGSIVVLL